MILLKDFELHLGKKTSDVILHQSFQKLPS